MRYLTFEQFFSVNENASEVELEYYDEVGQHGAHRVPSIAEGISQAQKLMENEELMDGTWYYGVFDYTSNTGAAIYVRQEYIDYLTPLDFTKTEENKQIYLDALKKCQETGEVIHYQFVV